jgi:hypothetical protein
MWRVISARLGVWLNHKPAAVPILIELRMSRLSLEAKRKGKGSDLAAAELRGMQTVILAMRGTR